MKPHLNLAGDIGGTKTNLALFSSDKGPLQPLHEKSYTSASFQGLEAIIEDFLAETETSAATACFGVAGPVRDGRAIITNLPWQPDSDRLQSKLGFDRVSLINDLVATGYALPHLAPGDLAILNGGTATDKGALGIVAPGTGLGEVIFIWDGSRYTPVPSEGGHTDFGPVTETEAELLLFFKKKYGHVSYDRVCSGRGLPVIYDFFKISGRYPEPEWLADLLAAAEDPAPVIVEAAQHESRVCDICRATLQLFISVLGAEAGNLALKGLTTGGIYLGGGIPPRILPSLRQGAFMKTFTQKGRMGYLLHDIPVRVILNPKAALIGAASHGLGLRFDSL